MRCGNLLAVVRSPRARTAAARSTANDAHASTSHRVFNRFLLIIVVVVVIIIIAVVVVIIVVFIAFRTIYDRS